MSMLTSNTPAGMPVLKNGGSAPLACKINGKEINWPGNSTINDAAVKALVGTIKEGDVIEDCGSMPATFTCYRMYNPQDRTQSVLLWRTNTPNR